MGAEKEAQMEREQRIEGNKNKVFFFTSVICVCGVCLLTCYFILNILSLNRRNENGTFYYCM